MILFLKTLKDKNLTLFLFGSVCLILGVFFFLLSKTSNTEVYGVNAWLKPLKFALSTWLFAWAMGWYCQYLPNFNPIYFNWTIVVLLGFEIAYIAIMASKGLTSHYNQSTALYSVMYSLMGTAATVVTLYTAYIGILFFKQNIPDLPSYYLWAIRLSILLFVIFSFQGFLMASRTSHTVGALNDNSNLFIVGWSKTVGDLRVAHFIGMHALQVLPLLAFYFIKNTRATIAVAGIYALLALGALVQALKGKPLIKQTASPTSAIDRLEKKRH